jgi:hypothetical protein
MNHRSMFVRTVLACDPAARSTPSSDPHGCLGRQLVPQVSSDGCGCSGGRAAGDLARDRFTHIPVPAQNAKTFTGAPAVPGLCPLPCCLIGQTRAKSA